MAPRLPWGEDLVLAVFGFAIAIGLVHPLELATIGWPIGVAGVLLYAAEHWAFAHRLSGQLARITDTLPDDDPDRFEAALPAPGYGLFVGSILRAAARVMVLGGALCAFGWQPDERPPGWIAAAYIAVLTAELVFALVWANATLRPPPPRPHRSAPPSRLRWTRHRIARWRAAPAPAHFAANALLLVWSCLVYGAACDVFGTDMARWSAEPDSMPVVALGAFLVFATGALAIPLQITLHLDAWLERAAYATTRARRWQLRAAAWCAMAFGLGEAWLALAKRCFG